MSAEARSSQMINKRSHIVSFRVTFFCDFLARQTVSSLFGEVEQSLCRALAPEQKTLSFSLT